MRTLRVISAVLMVLVLAFSLNDSHNAATSAKRTANEVRLLAHRLAVSEYERAVASCGSSTQLRKLLNDLDEIIKGANQGEVSEALTAFDKRIHAFTDHNPNCEHIPPRPHGASGTK